jgi:hypothetical protein
MAFVHSRKHRALAAAGALLVLALVLTAAPPARADHNNPAALCNEKFKGEFDYRWSLPIKSRRTGKRIGRVAISVQEVRYREMRRVCAVTLRRYHKRRRFTSIKIKGQNESKWRKDASYVYKRYAGPVVRRNPQGYCVNFVGRIRGGVPVNNSYCW